MEKARILTNGKFFKLFKVRLWQLGSWNRHNMRIQKKKRKSTNENTLRFLEDVLKKLVLWNRPFLYGYVSVLGIDFIVRNSQLS